MQEQKKKYTMAMEVKTSMQKKKSITQMIAQS